MADPATILLVEDDHALLEGIADLLEVSDTGYNLLISKATDGHMGLQKVAESKPDLIISDIMMPRMGGFEFLEKLRQRPEWVHIPVIFLTAKGTHQDILKGRVSGAELYITKPYDSNELIQLVNSQLDRTFQLRGDRQRQLDAISHNIIHLLNHEFRTPLTYVKAYNELLTKGFQEQDGGDIREYLEGIQVGTRRLNKLVRNLVQVMRLRTGQAAQSATKHATVIHNLPNLLDAFFSQKRRDPELDDVSFSFQFPEKLPKIYADMQGLFYALECILDNSIKFSRMRDSSSPEIVISASSADNEVSISVIDNGIGLPKSAQGKVFDLFYQHNRDEIEQQGAGLGLAIVKGLVELNGGRVSLVGDERYGCKVTLRFPVYRDEIHVSENGSGDIQERHGAKILLVEDEWYLLDGLSELLSILDSDYDIKVLKARDGEEALKVMRKHKVDLIVSDIMMPNVDGYELLSRVRANPAWVSIPFIFLTAKGDRRDIVRGRSSGAEEYITKPYDANELFSLILAQLDKHFHRQYIVHQNFEDLKRNVVELLMADIRLPLDVVTEYSQQMATNLEITRSEDELRVSLEAIQDGSEQVYQIIEEFILLVELRTGSTVDWFSTQTIETDINQLLQDISHLWVLQQGPGAIKFVFELDPSHPRVNIDPQLFRRGVDRLIGSWLDMDMEGAPTVIHIATSAVDGNLQVMMTVPGNYRPSEEVEVIQAFLNKPEAITPELFHYEPALLITKGIICYYHGTLEYEQLAGHGTTIRMTLPVSPTNDNGVQE